HLLHIFHATTAVKKMREAHGRRYAPEAPQRKARGLKKHYGFSRNNPPSC
ncbi:hypothetical protein LTSEMON_6438, partial [Salmonella enterica subsp. enterica serovar Montevideo str. S5-403]